MDERGENSKRNQRYLFLCLSHIILVEKRKSGDTFRLNMSPAAKYTVGMSAGFIVGIASVLFTIQLIIAAHIRGAQLQDYFNFVFPPLVLFSSWPSVVASLAQFPLYGWILSRGWVRGAFPRTFLCLTIAHVIAVLLGLYVQGKL